MFTICCPLLGEIKSTSLNPGPSEALDRHY